MNSSRAQTVALSPQGFHEGRNMQDRLTRLRSDTDKEPASQRHLHHPCTTPDITCAALQQERSNFSPPLFGSVGTTLQDHQLQILALQKVLFQPCKLYKGLQGLEDKQHVHLWLLRHQGKAGRLMWLGKARFPKLAAPSKTQPNLNQLNMPFVQGCSKLTMPPLCSFVK